jgi:hypothetical protein
MKGLKAIIVGIGFLISGVLGVAIGNLEVTLYYAVNHTGSYKQSATYYLFLLFIIVGIIYIIMGFMKKYD